MSLTSKTPGDTSNGSSLTRRILSGSGWSIISSAAAQLIGLITMIACARLLGSSVFGKLIVLQTTISTVGLLSGFGVGATAIRYLPTHRHESAERIGHILGLCERTVLVFGTTASALAMLFSAQISRGLLHSPDIARPLAIALLSILFLALDGFYKSALIGLERMKSYAVAAIAGQVWNFCAVFFGAATGGLLGAAIGLAASGAMQALVSRVILHRDLSAVSLRFVRKGSSTEWRVLRDFALPSLLSSAMVGPAHWLCQMILTANAGGFHEIAILGVAMQWFNAILLLPSAAGRVLTPILVESAIEQDHGKSFRVLRISVTSLAIVTVPCATLIAAFSGMIIAFYGNEFRGEQIALQLVALAGAIAAIASPIGNILIARSRAWLGFLMNLGWAFVYVGLSYMLRSLGAAAVTGSLAIAYIALTICILAWVFGATKRSDPATA